MINLIFDTETTGLPKHRNAKLEIQPQIIEWGGALVNGNGDVLKELNILINPGCPLPEKIIQITGITDEDLKNAPSFGEVLPQIREMFAAADSVIAHNLPFDTMMMELELERLKITEWPWPQEKICTVQEHLPQWGYRPKLTQLYHHYIGEKMEQTHRALDDVKALAQVCIKAGVLL